MNREQIAKQNDEKWFQGKVFTACVSDPEFQEIARNFLCGEILEENILSDKQKALILLTAPQELKAMQDHLSAYCFGDFYTRGTLDLKMRELITFCAICCLGGCEP